MPVGSVSGFVSAKAKGRGRTTGLGYGEATMFMDGCSRGGWNVGIAVDGRFIVACRRRWWHSWLAGVFSNVTAKMHMVDITFHPITFRGGGSQ